MVKKKSRKRETLKKKKKVSYLIFATEGFRSKQIGETKSDEESKLIGRRVNVLLSELTGDPKTQNIKLGFRIVRIRDGKTETEVCDYKMIPAYIKRIVRAGKSKIDDSFLCKSKDGVRIQLKPIILTRFKTQKSIKKDIRKRVKEYFIQAVEKEDYSKFVSLIISKSMQRELSRSLKKIYPVGIVDLRVMRKIG